MFTRNNVHSSAPAKAAQFSARVWDNQQEFQAAKAEWNELAEAVPYSQVFLRHEWFAAALSWQPQKSSLRIIAVYRDNQLVGIAPLQLIQTSHRGIPIRKLGFITVPDTQMCDIIASNGNRPEVLEAISRQLSHIRSHWDILKLTHLPNSSLTAKELGTALERQGLQTRITQFGCNPSIQLNGTWKDYYGRRSRRLKKGNNLIANKLKRSGHTIEIRQFNADNSDAHISRILDEMIEVSANSWKKTTGLSLENPGPKRFITQLTQDALENGWLSLWVMYLDKTAVAMEYQLRYGGLIHALRSDFKQTHEHLSPGTYLNWKMLESLFESNDTLYMMGPGSNNYKLRWAEEMPSLNKFTVYNKSMRGHWLSFEDNQLRPVIQNIRGRFAKNKVDNEDI